MAQFVRVARWLLTGAIMVYTSGVVALALLWTCWPRDAGWLALTEVFAPHVFWPLLLLVPVALVVRSAWLRGAVGALLVLFVALFGGSFVPRSVPPAEGTPLRVATFNHLFNNKHTDEIIAAIRAQNADVVALQELSPRVAEAVREQFTDVYPYRMLLEKDNAGGLGLLSRYPLNGTTVERGALPYQIVTLEVGEQQITVVNIHPRIPKLAPEEQVFVARPPFVRVYDPQYRNLQFQVLDELLDRTPGPLLLMGDFNLSDRESPYPSLAARMTDVFRATSWGFGFTFPNGKQFGRVYVPRPLVRIDYVWVRDIAPVAARVDCRETGSDHCMLIADLGLQPARTAQTERR